MFMTSGHYKSYLHDDRIVPRSSIWPKTTSHVRACTWTTQEFWQLTGEPIEKKNLSVYRLDKLTRKDVDSRLTGKKSRPSIYSFEQSTLVLISKNLFIEELNIIIKTVTGSQKAKKRRHSVKFAYMYLCSGFWVKPTLYSVPEQLKTMSRIYNEHLV